MITWRQLILDMRSIVLTVPCNSSFSSFGITIKHGAGALSLKQLMLVWQQQRLFHLCLLLAILILCNDEYEEETDSFSSKLKLCSSSLSSSFLTLGQLIIEADSTISLLERRWLEKRLALYTCVWARCPQGLRKPGKRSQPAKWKCWAKQVSDDEPPYSCTQEARPQSPHFSIGSQHSPEKDELKHTIVTFCYLVSGALSWPHHSTSACLLFK